MSEKPKRRFQMTLTLGADSMDEILSTLNHLQYELHDNGERDRNMVSGGYSSGFVLDIRFNAEITHDSWYTALQEYLAERKSDTADRDGVGDIE